MQEKKDKVTIWEFFIRWWYWVPKVEKYYGPQYEFPENEFGQCKHFDPYNSMSCLRKVAIYAICKFEDGETYPLCQMHYDKQEDEYSYSGPSEADEHYDDKKEFIKLFRNWNYGYITDEQVSEYSLQGFGFTGEETLEIFRILQLYVMTNDKSAKQFDEWVAQFKSLTQVIKQIL